MSAHSKFGQSGFSLVELMVGVAILAIMIGIAVPSYRTMIENSQIRNAAESIQNGLQRARAEAVARNTNVEFVLQPVAANDQTSWKVQLQDGTPIDFRNSNEGSLHVTRTVTRVGVVTNSTTVTFDSMGRPLATNFDGSTPFDAVDLDSSTLSAAESKDLRVTIKLGGNARMCDPNISTGPRACN